MKVILTPDKSDAIVALISELYYRFPQIEAELREIVAKSKKGMTLEIKPYVASHTRQQEKYYWKWVREFADHTGNTPDEMHDHLLRETYGTEYIETAIGIRARPRQRSSTADVNEYSRLIDTLIRVAAQLDFIVPPPLQIVNG